MMTPQQCQPYQVDYSVTNTSLSVFDKKLIINHQVHQTHQLSVVIGCSLPPQFVIISNLYIWDRMTSASMITKLSNIILQ